MNYLIWRQYRKLIIFSGAALIAYAIFLIISGLQINHAYHHALAVHTTQYFTINQLIHRLVQVSIAVPLLIGLFWGVPLVAKEYQDDTNKLAWTQSVSRRQWLSAKLGWLIAAAAVYGAVTAAAVTYWSQTLSTINGQRFAPLNFDIHSLMPVVYAVFAAALGAAIGAWLKQVLWALAVTLFVFVALQYVVANFVRPHYEAPITHVHSFNAFRSTSDFSSVASSGGWQVSQKFVEPKLNPKNCQSQSTTQISGNAHADGQVCGTPGYCGKLPANTTNPKCAAKIITVYQPANRYWPFQFIEAAIYLALTAIAVAATYLFVLKRDA
ncbi:MAG: ABC transporter permease [Candidatus Saccharimonadales bacterium]